MFESRPPALYITQRGKSKGAFFSRPALNVLREGLRVFNEGGRKNPSDQPVRLAGRAGEATLPILPVVKQKPAPRCCF